MNINLVLKSNRMPENAGKIRWLTANTIMATNPTVRAWREAPQIPAGIVGETDAHMASMAETSAQT